MLRAIPDGFEPNRLAEIDRRIEAIRNIHRVSIPLAIESGSRAWGFPSPDSDYDVRFIYVRQAAAYLSPWQPRDVIETPLEDDMDVNGWDLGKALRLMLKGNAVIIEWLRSPIAYAGDEVFRAEMLALAEAAADRLGLARHYYHLGTRQWRTYFEMGEQAAIKKLFYAARPALALRWLRVNAAQSVPPMHFPTLLAEADAPVEVVALCDELIAKKAITRELGSAPVPPPLSIFIEAEFALAEPQLAGRAAPLSRALRSQTEAFFHAMVMRYETPGDSPT
jgi:uncharacterized protein